MTEFKLRLKSEYVELTKKLIKLERFINTPQFEGLPIKQRSLLMEQQAVMTEYVQILKDRYQLIVGEQND